MFAAKLPSQRDVGTLLLSDLGERLPGAVLELVRDRGEVSLRDGAERLAELARFLKESGNHGPTRLEALVKEA